MKCKRVCWQREQSQHSPPPFPPGKTPPSHSSSLQVDMLMELSWVTGHQHTLPGAGAPTTTHITSQAPEPSSLEGIVQHRVSPQGNLVAARGSAAVTLGLTPGVTALLCQGVLTSPGCVQVCWNNGEVPFLGQCSDMPRVEYSWESSFGVFP